MDKICVTSLFIIFLFNCNLNSCAKILGVFPSPGYSQYMLVEPLMVALAKRGHFVTVISSFQTENVQNLRSVVVDIEKDKSIDPGNLFKLQELSIFENIAFLNQLCLNFTEDLLSNGMVQELINSEETFDIVIVETFLSEALQAFANHFDAHQVLFSSISVSEWNTHLVGIPNMPSYLPVTFSGYTTSMNWYARLRNTLALWYNKFYRDLYIFSSHQKLVDKYFPNKYILEDIMYNASIILTCSHVSTSETVPLTTNVVEVGGLHISNNKLPETVQAFLDSAEHGAIFFSMGSNVQSSSLPKETVDEIIAVIESLKQKVLWKFEDENLENKPSNLMISKWFPQSDILAHPNTVIFISHCGMGSTTEAVYHGVPVIGIPIYGDQFMNLRKLIRFGMAIELPFQELSAGTFNNSIQHILHYYSEYKGNATKRSRISKDRPLKPLEEAIYWIEYVLAHDGAHHLKSSILSLSWFQLYSVDILLLIAFTVCCFVSTACNIYLLLCRLMNWPRQKRKVKIN